MKTAMIISNVLLSFAKIFPDRSKSIYNKVWARICLPYLELVKNPGLKPDHIWIDESIS